MRVALMIEGQEDVTWEDWRSVARTSEQAGIEALFTSDHYYSVFERPGRGSFDVWAVLGAVAAVTEHIRIGTMVSPVTFRHPSVLAKAAVTVDHISDGRLEVGLGAGWWAEEHRRYGFPLPRLGDRMALLEEQLEIVHRSWTEPVLSFSGSSYELMEAPALPKPVQRPHPPLIVAGQGLSKTVRAAARWADEYNVFGASPEECRELRSRLDDSCARAGRDPDEVRLSAAVRFVVGRDHAEVAERERELEAWSGVDRADETLSGLQWIIGTVDEVVTRIRAFGSAGVDRIVLQQLVHRDLDLIELVGTEVVPAVGAADWSGE